jgi:hypothetical protein
LPLSLLVARFLFRANGLTAVKDIELCIPF